MTSWSKRELPLEQLMPLIREQLNEGKSVQFSPRGTSMLPLIRQGKDCVVLSPLPEKLKKYDILFYRRNSGAYVLHRIIGIQGENITCMGDHQFVPEPGIQRENAIAIVSAIYREDRKIEMDSFFYGLYCRFWDFFRPLRYAFHCVVSWFGIRR